MKITQKETQVNTVIISVDIKESDYAPALKDALSDYRKKINFSKFCVFRRKKTFKQKSKKLTKNGFNFIPKLLNFPRTSKIKPIKVFCSISKQ